MKKIRTISGIIAVTLLAVSAMPVCATIVTFQQGVSGYTGNTDATLLSTLAYSTTPFPSNLNPLQIGTFGNPGDSDRVVLLRHDTSSLAGLYMGINSISITFRHNGGLFFPTGIPVSWSLYEVAAANKDWVNTVSTWNQKYGMTNWASGASFGGTTPVSGIDFVATPLATMSFTYDGMIGNIPPVFTWNFSGSSAALKAIVDQWSGTQTNNAGMFLLLDSYATANRYMGLYGAGAGNSADRPVLTIDYRPIPEPSGLVLAMVASAIGAGVMRRRSV